MQGVHEWAACDHGPDAGKVKPIGGAAQHFFKQCRRLGTVLRQNGQRLARKSGLLQRVEPFRCPTRILNHTDREPSDISLNHLGDRSTTEDACVVRIN